MLAPRHVIFTAVEGALRDRHSLSCSPAADALAVVERLHVPLVLSTVGTRAQLEPIRRNIAHSHPFITESGGAAFLPDGYFSLALAGARRVARYFCSPFGRPYGEVRTALEEIAAEAQASVVGFGDMNAREIARNTGEPVRTAELAREREFSERFFFAGDTGKVVDRFAEIACRRKWELVAGQPFWEMRSGNDQGRAVRYLMSLYRKSIPSRLSSVGIGSTAQDVDLLSAVDRAIILPSTSKGFDATLAGRLPNAISASAAGPAGWNEAVLSLLNAQ